jgi:hypothetical protein
MELVLDAPGTPRALQQFFEDAFAERGWSSPPMMMSPYGPPGMGGFQPQVQPLTSSAFCQPGDNGYLTLSVRPLTEGTSDVRLSWYPPREEPANQLRPIYFTPCSMPDFPSPPVRPPFIIQSPIPTLAPPAGVRLQPTGGSGGPGTWGSEAQAETEISATALETHFSQQLAEAGWSLAERGAGSNLAWSTWQVPAEEDEQLGVLLIVELPEAQRRALSVRVYSRTGDFGPFGR